MKFKLGRRVFPIMSQLLTADQELWVIQRYNKYIRKHMAKIAKLVRYGAGTDSHMGKT